MAEHASHPVFALATLLAVTVAVSGCGQGGHGTSVVAQVAALPSRGCPVTLPRPTTPPGEPPGGTWEGNGGLWTTISTKATIFATRPVRSPPEGTAVGVAEPDGSVYAKFFWVRDRRALGRLHISGVRLDGPRGHLRVSTNQSFGLNTPTVPSALTFSSQGCWRVTARSGRAHLAFVVKVIRGS